jgi:hypothetical protein
MAMPMTYEMELEPALLLRLRSKDMSLPTEAVNPFAGVEIDGVLVSVVVDAVTLLHRAAAYLDSGFPICTCPRCQTRDGPLCSLLRQRLAGESFESQTEYEIRTR